MIFTFETGKFCIFFAHIDGQAGPFPAVARPARGRPGMKVTLFRVANIQKSCILPCKSTLPGRDPSWLSGCFCRLCIAPYPADIHPFCKFCIIYNVRKPGRLHRRRGCDKMISVINMEIPNRKPNRIAGYDYRQEGAYFVTLCTQDRKKILSRISVGTPVPGCPQEPCVELLWHGEVADKYIRQMDAFYEHLSVDQYIIMPDHIHLLIAIHDGHPGRGVPTRTSEIARFVGTFKRFCNKEYGSNIWQSRYYDHVIRNQQDYNEVWEYIENSPTKWVTTKDII